MKTLLVLVAAAAFAALVAGARATDDRTTVLLCVSSQTYADGSLSTAEKNGRKAPDASVHAIWSRLGQKLGDHGRGGDDNEKQGEVTRASVSRS